MSTFKQSDTKSKQHSILKTDLFKKSPIYQSAYGNPSGIPSSMIKLGTNPVDLEQVVEATVLGNVPAGKSVPGFLKIADPTALPGNTGISQAEYLMLLSFQSQGGTTEFPSAQVEATQYAPNINAAGGVAGSYTVPDPTTNNDLIKADSDKYKKGHTTPIPTTQFGSGKPANADGASPWETTMARWYDVLKNITTTGYSKIIPTVIIPPPPEAPAPPPIPEDAGNNSGI